MLIFIQPLASICFCSPPALSGAALPGTRRRSALAAQMAGQPRGTVTHRGTGRELRRSLPPRRHRLQRSPPAGVTPAHLRASPPLGAGRAAPGPASLPLSFSPFARRPHSRHGSDRRREGRARIPAVRGTGGKGRETEGGTGDCYLPGGTDGGDGGGQERGMEEDSSSLDGTGGMEWGSSFLDGTGGRNGWRATAPL